jgi:hypothetical protein
MSYIRLRSLPFQEPRLMILETIRNDWKVFPANGTWQVGYSSGNGDQMERLNSSALGCKLSIVEIIGCEAFREFPRVFMVSSAECDSAIEFEGHRWLVLKFR